MKTEKQEQAPTLNDVEIPPKEVVRIKLWKIELIDYADGSTWMKKTNDGFTSLELLGLCNHSSIDIMRQIAGEIKPDIITRTVIEDTKE